MRVSPFLSQRIVVVILWARAAITVGVLLYIIAYILIHGLPHLSLSFLTLSPEYMGRRGGVFPMVGSHAEGNACTGKIQGAVNQHAVPGL